MTRRNLPWMRGGECGNGRAPPSQGQDLRHGMLEMGSHIESGLAEDLGPFYHRKRAIEKVRELADKSS